MQLFECQNCGQLLYFENTRFERLGYLTDLSVLGALAWEEDGWWRSLAAADRPELVLRQRRPPSPQLAGAG